MSAAADLARGESYSTPVPDGYVSTLYRRSSALTETPIFYYETMAFMDGCLGIAWHSATSNPREADRQHALAVRWLARTAAPAREALTVSR